jgi:hypothetical protein
VGQFAAADQSWSLRIGRGKCYIYASLEIVYRKRQDPAISVPAVFVFLKAEFVMVFMV